MIIYPCRGTRGIHLTTAYLEKAGFKYDREWTIITKVPRPGDEETPPLHWVSINQSVEIGSISCRFEYKSDESDNEVSKYLVFSHPDMPEDLWVNTEKDNSSDYIDIFNFEKMVLKTRSEGKEAAEWVSKLTGKECMLVRGCSENASTGHSSQLGFELKESDLRRTGHTDCAYHICSEKSLARLQSKIPDLTLTIDQFRPNVVIDGIEPDEEDNLRQFELIDSSITCRVVKFCVRCKATTFNKELRD